MSCKPNPSHTFAVSSGEAPIAQLIPTHPAVFHRRQTIDQLYTGFVHEKCWGCGWFLFRWGLQLTWATVHRAQRAGHAAFGVVQMHTAVVALNPVEVVAQNFVHGC